MAFLGGLFGSSDPPPAPNPQATIAQQQAANQATALRNLRMNALNQSNPFGSVSTTYGPEGNPIVNWGFSGTEQPIYNQSAANRAGAGAVTAGALGNVANDVIKPLDTRAVEGRLTDLYRQRMDPILQMQRQARETQLMNAGAQPGTEAWQRAQDQLGRNENDAYTQMLLQGNQQAFEQLMGLRQANLGTLGGLFGLGQPQTPSWLNQPQYSENPVDVAGITQQGYQNSLLPWQNEQANKQAMMGGLFGLGGAALGGWARGLGGFKGF